MKKKIKINVYLVIAGNFSAIKFTTLNTPNNVSNISSLLLKFINSAEEKIVYLEMSNRNVNLLLS
jgi:hypothetical protein